MTEHELQAIIIQEIKKGVSSFNEEYGEGFNTIVYFLEGSLFITNTREKNDRT